MSDRRWEQVQDLCDAVAEMKRNATFDLVGDHRKNYVPRIEKAFSCLALLFPVEMGTAILKAKLFGD